MSDTKEDVKRIILEIVELVDDKMFGDDMDSPYVDELEAAFVDRVVDYLWDLENTRDFQDDLFPWSA